MGAPVIPKQKLFARLAKGHAAGITVVTPNRRLAQVLKSDFDRFQVKKSLPVWEDADILPFSVFVERLHEDSLYSDAAADLPQLLTPAQGQAIWESILPRGELLAVADTAANCSDSWALAQAWRIAGALDKFPCNEDSRAFAGWARQYAQRCDKEGLTDAARLADFVLQHASKRPQLLVAYGFDVTKPQESDFFGLCRQSGIEVSVCGPETKTSAPIRVPFNSARDELDAAAQWARARLEAGASRIGVVVPDLKERRREVLRIFSSVMRPGYNASGAEHAPLPFDVSSPEPLSEFPLVAGALLVLEASIHEIGFADASCLIRSPFIEGAETERDARARLDARLRKRMPARFTLPKLIGELDSCPRLRAALEALFAELQALQAATLLPHEAAQHFSALLKAAGFPGERGADSAEFQAQGKFNEMLGELARLGRVVPALTRRNALSVLKRLCDKAEFQPETPDAPVQVLGLLESLGLEFDCLWVSGLTEEAWPLKASPDPFLPVSLQKKAGIPEASAEGTLARARRLTEGWLGAADEVVFSWPEKEEDRDLAPSPLLFTIPIQKIEIEKLPNYRELIFESKNLETIEDGKAPAITTTEIRGGTRVLADQAACPFRAFARHRLGAADLESPAEGLNAMQRGRLLHTLMAGIWSELKSSFSLAGDVRPAIEKSAAHAVKELGLEGRFAELEKRRLEAIAREWLEIEKERESFEVVAIERPAGISIASLLLRGRIDRMDRLEGGSHAIIDYKSGRATPNDWLGERPDEPQMPLYAVSAQEGVSTVAYAKLQRGEMKWAGFSLKEKEIPGVKQAKSWPGLLEGWQAALDSLAAGFARGDARVDPKKGLATCRNCGLQPLCRVHEKLNALSHDDEGGD